MLPVMVFSFIITSFNYLKFMRDLQNTVEEIWLDKSGMEVRIVYRNKGYRQLRGVQSEEKMINSSLVSPAVKPESLAGRVMI